MRAILDRDVLNIYSKSINSTRPVKKFYLAMEFNKINNPEFQDERLYSLSMFDHFKRTPLYTPQINNISMVMPSVPILYEWDAVPQVALIEIILIIKIFWLFFKAFQIYLVILEINL